MFFFQSFIYSETAFAERARTLSAPLHIHRVGHSRLRAAEFCATSSETVVGGSGEICLSILPAQILLSDPRMKIRTTIIKAHFPELYFSLVLVLEHE